MKVSRTVLTGGMVETCRQDNAPCPYPLSGAGSAGRNSTVVRQHGHRPSTPWFTALQSRPREFLDFTSVTLDEFQQLVPPFEAAFQARMAVWRMDGKPRTARRFTVYQNGITATFPHLGVKRGDFT